MVRSTAKFASGNIIEKADIKELQKTHAKELSADKLMQNGKPVPAIVLAKVGDAYQLQITLDPSKS